MSTFKHILVPTDFGESSRNALDLAVELATTFSSELTVMHSWEIPAYPYMEYMLSAAELANSVEQAAGRGLEETLQQLKKRVSWAKSVLKAGVPWRQILEASNELHSDLIVMGTHGRHGIDHALMGSVAEKVVRLAKVPVLTVHPTPPARASL